MKKIFFAFFILFASSTLFAQQFKTLELSKNMPLADYTMLGVDGQEYRLQDFEGAKGLLVIFTSNTCPFVVAWEDRYKLLEEICKKQALDMVYINSNHLKREGDDSYLAMQEHAKKQDYQFPYLLDEKSVLANAFGAKTTPHIFLFNKQSELVYKGSIDDNYESAQKVEHFYLKDAIDSMLNGNEIKTSETKAVGCSIKRYLP